MFILTGLEESVARWPELKGWERKELGQKLRRLGLSYREIAEIVPVAKGTLSAWCRDVEVTDEQQARLREKRPRLAARQAQGVTMRRRALERRAAIRAAAREEAGSLAQDPFWSAGVVAYWAEGSKRSNRLSFSNSDPRLVCLFIAWVQRYLEVGLDRVTVRLHLHDGQDEAERKALWLAATGVPKDQFGKTFIKPEGTGHRKNILYQGTAEVCVRRSTDLFHRVMGWIDSLSEQATFRSGR